MTKIVKNEENEKLKMVLTPKLLGQESLFLLGIKYLSSSFKASFIDFLLPKDPDFMTLLIL